MSNSSHRAAWLAVCQRKVPNSGQKSLHSKNLSKSCFSPTNLHSKPLRFFSNGPHSAHKRQNVFFKTHRGFKVFFVSGQKHQFTASVIWLKKNASQQQQQLKPTLQSKSENQHIFEKKTFEILNFCFITAPSFSAHLHIGYIAQYFRRKKRFEQFFNIFNFFTILYKRRKCKS